MTLSFEVPDLPLAAHLPQIEAAVTAGDLVMTAAPGAGKSSLVPFAVVRALARRSTVEGRVIVLQPRRLAARATAARLAELAGEPVGRSVGFTIRGERTRGRRIEVVTEAILTNRLQRDPELEGVEALIFDEFHERNLHSDLGLAMAIEARSTVRPDLRIVVMSATIDPDPIAALLGADHHPVTTIDAPGRVFPVQTEHRARPMPDRWADATAIAVDDAVGRVSGDVLAFVPGRAEIDRVIERLSSATRARCDVIGLHGSSRADVQRAVLSPADGRRVIVATAIAETSVTIPGVEAVVDGGLSRRPRYDAKTATSHLVTEFVSRFSAEQREGRAGRTRPGICLRLWSAADHELLAEQATPEIVEGDPLVVAAELLRWGDPDGAHLPLLDRPDPGRLAEAGETMSWWGLTSPDDRGRHRLTELGRAVAGLPTHPRVGALLATVVTASDISDALVRLGWRAAALLDLGRFPATDDFEQEIEEAASDREVARAADRLQTAVGRTRFPPPAHRQRPDSLGDLLALAWPDRIAVRREGTDRFQMASGRDVELDRSTGLRSADAIVVVESTVSEASGRVRRAIPIERGAISRLHQTEEHRVAEWDRRRGRIAARREVRHGSIVLHAEPWPDPDPDAIRRAAADGVRFEGLGVFRWTERANTIRKRLAWLHSQDERWPDVSDDSLVLNLDRWLDLSRVRSADDLQRVDVGKQLIDLLDWEQRRAFDELAPTERATPSGRNRRIDWSGDRPVWPVRVQDLFGLDQQPMIGPGPEPLTIELLSPAGRVAQTTTDLPGFWRGSYAAVRADLRGRYPKHAWPEDPTI